MSPLSQETRFGLTLLAATRQAELAAPVLARATGVSPDEALERLARGPGLIGAGLRRRQAAQVAVLLGLLGLQVRVSAPNETVDPLPPRFDLALQVTGRNAARAAAPRLAAWLGRTETEILAGLARPGGVVLAGQTWDAVTRWRRRTRGMAGLQVLVSDPLQATYVLLPWETPAVPAQVPGLLRFLRRLGLARCPVTGAIATGLDLAMVRIVLKRYPGCGLVALNSHFQRFDLVLSVRQEPIRHELASFLAARTALPPTAFQCHEALAGLRIESALNLNDALAFQADYAAMGLDTRLRLVPERSDGPD